MVGRFVVFLQPKKTTNNEKDSYVLSYDVPVCVAFGADGERDIYGTRCKQPTCPFEPSGCQQPHQGVAGDIDVAR